MRFLKFLFWSCLALFCAFALSLSGAFLYLSPNLPSVDSLRSIQLQIPLFCTIMGSINGLETRVAGLENMTTQIKAQVESIQRQLDSLQQEANRRREAEARQAAAVAAAAIAAAQAQFYAVDPLAFAVMKGTSLTDESSPAIIGPAWGPDFPPELAVAFNLVQKRNQRATLANRMKELFW